MRPVVAKCYAPGEANSPDSLGAWGFVYQPIGQQKDMHLDPLVCQGALSVNDPLVPAWQRALGVMVLIHESYHLRRWSAAGNEAQVQCRAIRHWKVGMRILGASEETITELWPFALVAHYELSNISDWFGERPYRDDNCNVPRLKGGE